MVPSELAGRRAGGPDARRDTWRLPLTHTHEQAHTLSAHRACLSRWEPSLISQDLACRGANVTQAVTAAQEYPISRRLVRTRSKEIAVVVTDSSSSSPSVLSVLPCSWRHRTARWWSSRGISCGMTSRSTSSGRLVCCRTTPSWRRRTSRCRSRSPCSNRAR